MVSVIRAPENNVPRSRDTTVTTGISALRNAWRHTTEFVVTPFAAAVRT